MSNFGYSKVVHVGLVSINIVGPLSYFQIVLKVECLPEGALGSQPRKALARELFPDPVGPTMMIRGLGSAGITWLITQLDDLCHRLLDLCEQN